MYRKFYQYALFRAATSPMPFLRVKVAQAFAILSSISERLYYGVKAFVGLLFFILLSATPGLAQGSISGLVKDQQGVPIAGATIQLKGTHVYAVADENGAFEIEAVQAPPLSLIVKFVGFKSKEVRVASADDPVEILLSEDGLLEEIVVTSRRRSETAQAVPIPISVVGGEAVSDRGAFNVNLVKELVPSVQLYSSNPRNTTLNIRGLGSTFGLTNDGIDPGVGFYVDGVYYARPAAAALDFIDIEQIEVLRGPQGTLFGKNTTAGAFNITTKKPTFTPQGNFELSYGNYGYIQAKASVSGPLSKVIAGRLSFSGTQRDGLLENVSTGVKVNDINNLGARGQLLFVPSEKTAITLSADATRQRPIGYAQVIAGVAPTLRPDYRQFEQIIADLNYTLPSRNPFDRIIDHDTPWRSGNDLGGISLNIDIEIGRGTMTSTSAWRYWKWDPSNDRDFTALPVLTKSQGTSRHHNWSQEVRYSGAFSSRLSGVIGLYAIGQELNTDPVHVEESGAAQWRFSQNSTNPLWQTPGLLDGYGIRTRSKLNTFSGALFGQLDWAITDRLHLLPGVRLNYDEKKVDFDRQTYGGLQTEDPELLALKRAIYSDQAFVADVDDFNLSGQLTLTYKATERVNSFATYSTSYKPVGVNLGGLPTADGLPMLDLAVIKPEAVQHAEVGIKTNPTPSSMVNVTLYNTDIRDYQTQVQAAQLGVNRGYLANAERVRVRGVEVEANTKVSSFVSLYGSLSYTDGKFVSFANAPVPLEETGGESAYKDISGSALPGISKWATSLGGEIGTSGTLFGFSGKFFLAADGYFRSSFSSSSSPSKYLIIDDYLLVNSRAGFKASDGVSVHLWSRNLLNKDYFEQLLPAGGNAGHYAAVLGDPRTWGLTLRYSF
ncbi:MAG TPA: TonB-dependent receptor [Cyclobacteriaceae bacterium]|nr:TonB-dependent receptor [Cyclobacteriaceae bacterium]